MPAVHAVIWRTVGVGRLGTEYCALLEADVDDDADKARLEGTVITAFDGEPALVRYSIICEHGWQTSALDVSIDQAAGRRALAVRKHGRGWRIGGAESEEPLRDSIDVDLGITPSTNTLPIRRLSLAVGEGAEVTAAWVRFPELTVEPLHQRYTRLAEDRYLYESLDSDFSAELTVDEHGLVMHYPGGWEMWVPNKD